MEPTVSPVAALSGISTAMCLSPPRSSSKGPPLPAASSGRPSSARRAASLGPREETDSPGGCPGVAVRYPISLWVSLRMSLARASLIA